MEHTILSLRISPQNVTMGLGNHIGSPPTVYEGCRHCCRALAQVLRGARIENMRIYGASRSSRSGNCIILWCSVIQLLATHCGTHQLRSLLARSENTIEIALQSTNQCTNFIMHTMHYEAAAMRCSAAQAARPPGRRQPGQHGRPEGAPRREPRGRRGRQRRQDAGRCVCVLVSETESGFSVSMA